MIPTKTIQLDFWRHPTDILHLVQGEADGRKVEFKIFDNGSAFDLTGFIAIFAIRKPDGNVVVNSATITEAELGIVETTISSQVVTTAGNAHAELHLMKEGQLSKSFRIVTKVAPSVDIDGIAPSVSEFNALQTLIGQAETVISIADTELWPEVVANAQYFSDLAGAGRTNQTVKANADDIADLAGAGRNTETVKGNADEIAALEAEIETARAGSATLGARLDADNAEASAQLADKVRNFKLKNEVVNGDFSGGTTGWSGANGIVSIVNGVANVTGNGENASVFLSPTSGGESTTMGDKIYLSGKIKSPSGATNLGFQFFNNLATVEVVTVGLNVALTKVSAVATLGVNCTSLRLGLRCYFPDGVTANGKTFEADDLLMVNLTKIFGAGNEPTKLEMDRLVEMVPNQWWDGELDLTQQQYVYWLLSFIREKADKAQEAWITPTLLNGWTTVQPVAYFIDNFGVVHVKGRVTDGTAGTLIFTLPTAYQPSQTHYYSSSADTGQCNLYVSTLGVTHLTGANTNVGLDVINYKKG